MSENASEGTGISKCLIIGSEESKDYIKCHIHDKFHKLQCWTTLVECCIVNAVGTK